MNIRFYFVCSLFKLTPSGLYCEVADIYIDPNRKVKNALITHAHADHARAGMETYICQMRTVPLLKSRIGKKIRVEGKEFGELFEINGVKFSLHPAGHIIGSAQIRAEYQAEVWVISGDYKVEDDGFTTPFESVPCDHFVTECTFGLPIYQFPAQEQIQKQMNAWVRDVWAQGQNAMLMGYSLGKAQRIIHMLDQEFEEKIIVHGTVQKMNDGILQSGVVMKKTTTQNKLRGEGPYVIVAPPNVQDAKWLNKFKPFKRAFCSGWMGVRGHRRWDRVDAGFAISDHADWNGLNMAVLASGAQNIYCTHGADKHYSRWLSERYGLNALPLTNLAI